MLKFLRTLLTVLLRLCGASTEPGAVYVPEQRRAR
jgi:hypothetical protein